MDGERWPSNGIRRPGLRAFAVGTIWEESRVCHCTVGQAKICARTAYGDRALELDVGPIFFSVRQINAISGFSDRWANVKHEHL